MNFFECKVSHDQVEESTGKKKKITDTYMVDALSFSEAEARLNEEVAPFYNAGEFAVCIYLLYHEVIVRHTEGVNIAVGHSLYVTIEERIEPTVVAVDIKCVLCLLGLKFIEH